MTLTEPRFYGIENGKWVFYYDVLSYTKLLNLMIGDRLMTSSSTFWWFTISGTILIKMTNL